MKSKTAAIKHARANVRLYQMGRQWRIDTYDARAKAWRQGSSTDYWQARASQSQALLDRARAFLDRPLVQYDGGSWTSYL